MKGNKKNSCTFFLFLELSLRVAPTEWELEHESLSLYKNSGSCKWRANSLYFHTEKEKAVDGKSFT